jgi:hypothetical protein
MDEDEMLEDEVYFVEEDERLDDATVDLDGGDEDYYEDGFGEEGNYSDD